MFCVYTRPRFQMSVHRTIGHLVLIFINDLPENSRPSVFDDDCVLYRNIKSAKDFQILQDDINSLAKLEN